MHGSEPIMEPVLPATSRRPISPPNSTEQALGRVEGALTAMEAQIAALAAAFDEDRKAASAGRQAVAESLSSVKAEVSSLRGDMDAVKPITQKLERWQAVGLGALLTVGAIGSVIGAFLAYFKDRVIAAIFG